MSSHRPFGRRVSSQSPSSGAAVRPSPGKAAEQFPTAAIMRDVHAAGADLDRELAEWQAMRKLRKRSFREPWRSVSIAAAIGFGMGSWLLPDSVASLAQLVTAGLALTGIAAGYRRRVSSPDDDATVCSTDFRPHP